MKQQVHSLKAEREQRRDMTRHLNLIGQDEPESSKKGCATHGTSLFLAKNARQLSSVTSRYRSWRVLGAQSER